MTFRNWWRPHEDDVLIRSANRGLSIGEMRQELPNRTRGAIKGRLMMLESHITLARNAYGARQSPDDTMALRQAAQPLIDAGLTFRQAWPQLLEKVPGSEESVAESIWGKMRKEMRGKAAAPADEGEPQSEE